MKKKITFLCLFILTFLYVKTNAQVGINTTNPKATLDVNVNSNTTEPSGVIAPRVTLDYLISNNSLYTTEQKGAIVYVYDVSIITDRQNSSSTAMIEKDGYYFFDGNSWVLFVVPDAIVIPPEPWKVEETGIEATLNNQNIVQNAKVGIGFENQINSSAQFEIRSSNGGLLIPRMTTKERDAIKDPANSLLVYTTDSNCFNFYKNDKWRSLCGDLGESQIIIPDCSSAQIKGEYKVGQVLNAGNYFQITVNVVEPGNYSILVNNSDQFNNSESGFFFQKEGIFPTKGNYTIQIPAVGTPIKSGTNNFTIRINDEIINCTASVVVSAADVKFNNIVFVGAEQLKKGENSTGKTFTIKIDVQNPGNFSFETNPVNNVTYSASNIALNTGNDQTVVLRANGNPPASAGNFSYDIKGTGYTGTPVSGNVTVIESLAVVTTISCADVKTNGTLRLNTLLTASNYLDIPITTTAVGTYTVSVTSTENPGFSYAGAGNITSTGTSVIRVYGTGTPTKAGNIPFTITVNGTTCTRDITVVLPPKNVLLVGDSFGQINAALSNTANFGVNGKSKIESINRINQGNLMTSTQLKNAINNQNVEVIIIGWNWNPDDASIAILSEFIKVKKGFVFWAESQDDQVYIKKLLDLAFNANVITTDDEYSIFTAKLDSNIPADNPYINGPFGNIADKIVRADDYASWLGFVPNSLPSELKGLLNLPRNGTTSTTASNSARTTFVYGNGFFMYPDWGMTNYSHYNYGFSNPIGVGSGTFNGYQGWDGTSVGVKNINNTNIVNWLLFGNAMDHIFNYVQQNYDRTYKIP